MAAQVSKVVLIINLIIIVHSRMIQALRFIEILKYVDGGQVMPSGILPANAHAEANILILYYINSFIFYSFNNRLSNNINCN